MDTHEYIIKKWEKFLETKDEKDYLSLYVNIPFCLKKCSYCMYPSMVIKDLSLIDEYLDFLQKEMELFAPVFKGSKISVVSFGGGTPSLLSIPQMQRLFDVMFKNYDFELSLDNMFSFEAHPGLLNKKKIAYLAETPVNRFNIGVQSLNAQVLKNENRKNPSQEKLIQLMEELMVAFESKHSRINIDLMAGLKGQTAESLIEDFKVFAGLKIPRITVYANRQRRKEKQQEQFEKDALDVVIKLNDHFSQYKLMGNADVYSECNIFVNKKYHHYFNKWYCGEPVLYNNTIGFGFNADSFNIPSRFWYCSYGKGKYQIVFDQDKDQKGSLCDYHKIFARVIANRKRKKQYFDVYY